MSRLRLVASVCLAILVGAALGYGFGLLNRKEPEHRIVAATQVPASPPVTRDEPRSTPEAPGDEPPEAPAAAVEPGKPRQPTPERPREAAWVRNAVRAEDTGDRPVIAVVIDDVGLNRAQTRKAVALPAPVTLAFLTYARHLPEQTASAHAAGHELLVHFPMEPLDENVDPGPNALLAGLSDTEISRRLDWGLSRFDGYVGVNNHMGSRFTANQHDMELVLNELKTRGLLFLDSVTTAKSVSGSLARRVGIPHTERDVFIDNSKEPSDIRASLALLEQRAREHGQAVGIGHPFDETIGEIAKWMAQARDRGFAFVPVSAIVRRSEAPLRRMGARSQDPAG